MTSRDELSMNEPEHVSAAAAPPHKIVLDYGNGHREPLDVPETMTLAQLHEHASRRSSETTTTTATAVLVTLKSGVPRPRILEHSPHVLARSMIPPQSRVFVETTVGGGGVPPEEVEDKNAEKQKKESNDSKSSNTKNQIIDLSTETDSDDDDVRGPTTIVPHPPPTKRAKTSVPQDAGSSSSSSDEDPAAETDDRDPTTVDHTPWIYQYGKLPHRDQKVLGKWLVFDSATKIAQTWRTIRQAVANATIPAFAAKVSTRWQQQNNTNNKSYVICVYSSAELMDNVAHALIPLVRRNISFKTDEATGSNRYAHNNTSNNVTIKTLYWNRGRPTFTKNTAKLMTPVAALTLAVQTAAQYKNNNIVAPPTLDYSFEIVVTCAGIQHYIPSLAQRRQLLVEGGATELVLIRDPGNEFDPKHAIRVELLHHTSNDTTDDCSSSDDAKKSQPTTTTSSTVVGYVTSTIQPHYARLLAPFLDRQLLKIDSAKCGHWVNHDSTVLDILVSGRAVREAQSVLAAL